MAYALFQDVACLMLMLMLMIMLMLMQMLTLMLILIRLRFKYHNFSRLVVSSVEFSEVTVEVSPHLDRHQPAISWPTPNPTLMGRVLLFGIAFLHILSFSFPLGPFGCFPPSLRYIYFICFSGSL